MAKIDLEKIKEIDIEITDDGWGASINIDFIDESNIWLGEYNIRKETFEDFQSAIEKHSVK